MKDFGARRFRLSQSPLELRMTYTAFLVFAGIGYLSFALLAGLRVGPGYADIVRHYRGSPGEEAFARPLGQMIEELHFHAFIVGVVLLVLCHLFAATSVAVRWKRAVPAVAVAAALADLACPWLVRFAGAPFAALQLACWAAVSATAAVLIAVPLREMWFRAPARSR